MLFKQIPFRKAVAVELAALLEEGVCVTGLARAFPGAGVGDENLAFSVREVFDEGACAG